MLLVLHVLSAQQAIPAAAAAGYGMWLHQHFRVLLPATPCSHGGSVSYTVQ